MERTTEIRIEKRLARRAAACLIRAGFTVEVYDGEETALARSTDLRAISGALMSTDEDYLIAWDASTGKRRGWVWLIYGNGIDLISDLTVNLEESLRAADELVERLEPRFLHPAALSFVPS